MNFLRVVTSVFILTTDIASAAHRKRSRYRSSTKGSIRQLKHGRVAYVPKGSSNIISAFHMIIQTQPLFLLKARKEVLPLFVVKDLSRISQHILHLQPFFLPEDLPQTPRHTRILHLPSLLISAAKQDMSSYTLVQSVRLFNCLK